MRVLSFSILVFFITLLLTLSHTTVAQVMQSSNYRLQSDSINVGGGFSTSTGYTLESTAGEIATGESTSASYALRAGYQQMQEVYLAMTGATAVTMTPTIPGVTGGVANGSTTVHVTTDSASGYTLSIAASQSPAMRKDSDSIADYAPAGVNPDYTFGIEANEAQFGFSPGGVDVVSRYLDDEVSLCNTGSAEGTLTCWDGLSTTPRIIATRTSGTHPNGATTTVNFRVEVGGSVSQPPGTYVATTTLTALPL